MSLSERLNDPELLEILSDIEHERWSGWEDYREDVVDQTRSGERMVARWQRLRRTAYKDLTEAEKESDRIEARKGLEAIRRYLNEPA